MLQFATCASCRHSVKEQVEIAINAGCRWIRLTGDLSDDIVEEIMPICREAEAILVLDDNIQLVDRLRIHGLHMTHWNRGDVIAARENLGPHAILGVTFNSSSSMEDLTGLDVDYIIIPPFAEEDPEGFYTGIMDRLKKANNEIHAVAAGKFPFREYPVILATGIEGIEISWASIDTSNPAGYINMAIRTLEEVIK